MSTKQASGTKKVKSLKKIGTKHIGTKHVVKKEIEPTDLTEKRLEELIYIVMELSRQVKECCRAFTIQALHSEDTNKFAKCIRSCMEMIEVSDLVLFILSNSSPNTKAALRFALEVVETTKKECLHHKEDEYCKNSCRLCTISFERYQEALGELYNGI